jgi:arginyl-tRNA synthetase
MLPQALHKITFGKHCIEDIFAKMGIPKRKLIIDFSSPNIAKTFHIGNLRFVS